MVYFLFHIRDHKGEVKRQKKEAGYENKKEGGWLILNSQQGGNCIYGTPEYRKQQKNQKD